MIKVKNVCLQLNQQSILSDISLEINRGQCLGIMGPSGAGKTSLLKVLAQLIKPSSGNVIYEAPIQSAFVFQNANLLKNKNVLQNALLPIKKTPDSINKALNLLNDFGLNEMTKKYPAQLSSGQQQRLAIIRALMQEPNIIFFDEPTANLDSGVVLDTLNILKRLNEQHQTTLVMVTHDVAVAKFLFDQVLWLADGKIVRLDNVKKINDLNSGYLSIWEELYD